MNKKYEINGETIYVEDSKLVVNTTYYNSADVFMRKQPRKIIDQTIFTREEIEERLKQLDEDWKNAYLSFKWSLVEWVDVEIKKFNNYLNILDDIMITKGEREIRFKHETLKVNCAIIFTDDCKKIDKILSASDDKIDRLKRILNGIPNVILCENEDDAKLIFEILKYISYHNREYQTYCVVDLYKNMIRIENGDY